MLGKIMFVTSRFGGIFPGMRMSLERMGTDFIEVPIWSMKESFETFHPQVMIFFHHFLKEWDENVMQEIQQFPCHKFLWDFETPWEIDYIKQYHHPFSYILVQDKVSATALQADIGNKVIFVPHAADPESCKQVPVPFEMRSDLCFIGAAYKSRLEFLRAVLPRLTNYKVIIAGTGFEFLPNTEGQKIINTGIGDEYWQYISGAKVCLNLHRKGDEMPIANTANVPASSPNNRFFELYMGGAFQLVDDLRRPEMHEYFDDIQYFKSPDHFMQRFEYWVAHDEERKIEALAKQKVALERHQYVNRFTEILAKLI